MLNNIKNVSTYMGIDLGTSGLKVILIDEDGNPVAEAHAELKVSRPHTNWSEQNPEDWWQACLKCVDELSRLYPEKLSKVAGIGLSGQMHGAIFLDKNHQLLRPAILWNDARSYLECAELEATCPTLRQISGNIAMAGFTAPKALWVKNNEPEIFARISKVLLPKDYIRFRLSGEMVSEMSDASGTLWLDVKKRDWSDDLLAATSLSRAQMPSLVEGNQISGELKKNLQSRWNMDKKVTIAGGAGDNASSACGIGAVRPGQGFVSLGTSGVLFVSTDRFSPNTQNAVHSFCHALPDTWHQMGVILSATDSLNWLGGITGRSPIELANDVASNFDGPASEIFLPYLSGERTPHNNANARASFAGLSHASSPTSLAQAVMEGVAFAFADSKSALKTAGTKIERLIAVGGGSNSELWLKIIAANLNMEIEVPHGGDFGAAFGAARLGLCAATGAEPSQICTPPQIRQIIKPDPELSAVYRDQYQRFKALYPAIQKATL